MPLRGQIKAVEELCLTPFGVSLRHAPGHPDIAPSNSVLQTFGVAGFQTHGPYESLAR